MRAGIAADQSSITAGVVQGLLRWFAKFADAAKIFLPRGHPVSAEDLSDGTVSEAGRATYDAKVKPTAAQSCATGLEVNVGPALITGPGQTLPDALEIERRRDLVRTLFNDFWRGAQSKPGSFAARLDEAEDYLNMRLAANGESWCLDANTRARLGLPPRAGSPH